MSHNKKPMAKRRSRVVSASNSRTSQLSKTDKLKIGKTSSSDLTNKSKSPAKRPIKKNTPAAVPVVSQTNLLKTAQNDLPEDSDNDQSPPTIEASSPKGIEHDELEGIVTTQEREHNMTYNLLVKSLFAIDGGEVLEPPWKMSMEKLNGTIEQIMTDMQEIDGMYQESAKKCVRLLRMWEVKQDMLTLLSANKAERENNGPTNSNTEEAD